MDINENQLQELIKELNHKLKQNIPFDTILSELAKRNKYKPRTFQKYINDYGYRYCRSTKQYLYTGFVINHKSIFLLVNYYNSAAGTNEEKKEKTIKRFCLKRNQFEEFEKRFNFEVNEKGILARRIQNNFKNQGRKSEYNCFFCKKPKAENRNFCSEDCNIKHFELKNNFIYFSNKHKKIYEYIKKKLGSNKEGIIYPMPTKEQYDIIEDLKVMELINFEIQERKYKKPETIMKIKLRW